MTPRYTRRPGRGAGKPWKRKRVAKKGGLCPFAIPAAASALLVVLAQLALVRWQIRGAR